MNETNFTHYEKDLKEFLKLNSHNKHDSSFLYDVGTYYPLLNTKDIEVYDGGDIKELLKKVIFSNPTSQFAEVFKSYFNIRLEELIKKADPYGLELHTMSDVGGVKVGNEHFNVIIPNGFGDGVTSVFITELNDIPANYFTSLHGTFNVYDYDCGEDVKVTLNGRYLTYFEDGVVVFNKF